MPIAPFPGTGGGPSAPGDTLIIVIPGSVLDPAPPIPFATGHAVSLRDIAGVKTLVLGGAVTATQYPKNFFGFLNNLSPVAPRIATGRGSRVIPYVQFGIPLVSGMDVYLSTTLGYVTQTAPMGVGHTVLRVGFAVSPTEIVLVTDPRVQVP